MNCEKDGSKNYDGVFAYAHAKRAQVILTEMWQEKLLGRGVTFHSTPSRLVRHTGRARQEYGLVQFKNGGEAKDTCPGYRYCGLAGRGPDDPRLDDSLTGGGDFWFDRLRHATHAACVDPRELF